METHLDFTVDKVEEIIDATAKIYHIEQHRFPTQREFAQQICSKFKAPKKVDIMEIKEALFRGYCSERNSSKTLDTALISDMAAEVDKLRLL